MAFAYNNHGYSTAYTSGSLSAPVTRSRTGLFLSYRDTVIRNVTASSRPHSATKSRKGKERAYGVDEEEERSGLLAEDVSYGVNRMNGHEAIQMSALPPQWSVGHAAYIHNTEIRKLT